MAIQPVLSEGMHQVHLAAVALATKEAYRFVDSQHYVTALSDHGGEKIQAIFAFFGLTPDMLEQTMLKPLVKLNQGSRSTDSAMTALLEESWATAQSFGLKALTPLCFLWVMLRSSRGRGYSLLSKLLGDRMFQLEQAVEAAFKAEVDPSQVVF